MRPDRENNYDLLRISCAIAIVVMHASGPYVLAATNNEFFGEYYVDNMLFSCMCNGITRFAVPCFVMLSGAFILDNDRNRDYRYFYKKAFCKIGITTLIFSILYTVYSFAKSLVGVVAWGKVASRMFLVYLIHAGILDICGEIVRQLLGVRMFDNRVVILVNTVLAFTGSYILSGMYTLIWRYIDQRTKITERLCNIMHLA